jgi:cytoskeleton-associated protein 5
MTWPEYPEEPSGDLILGALKKAWSPLIPLESTKHLFPGGDIKKQDDAMAGCELLSRAIVMDRAEEGFIIGEQFSLIWKWMTFVLCCKESTVGTQSLLQLTSDLIDHLRYMKYEISDAEAMVFVPHLFDKASAAKGRFKETYMDLIEQFKAEDLLPTKRLGPLVCVGIIEGSSYPKARLLACKECQLCVEKIGLSGVGKRGVLAVAKSLSEENLQENRNALVELMASLVLRMNGDMQRFTRICGPSLSGKARSLIEERLKKGGFPASAALKPRTSVLSPSPHTSSIVFKESKATPSKAMNRATLTPKSSPDAQPDYDVDEEIKDELPALDLRLGMRPTPISSVGIARPQTSRSSLTSGVQRDSIDVQKVDQRQSDDVGNTIPSPTEEDRESLRSILFTSSSHDSESSLGAAASLRARLIKIRERNKTGPVPTSGENSPHRGRSDEPQTAVVELFAASQDQDYRSSTLADLHVEEASNGPSSDLLPGVSHLVKFLDAIRRLLSRDLPLSEEDGEIIECTDVLKSIHAAVSQQPGLAVNLDVDGVSRLRQEIKANSNEVVETLTR